MYMKRFFLLLLCLALLLTGCNWMGGTYVSVVPYEKKDDHLDQGITAVSSYQELRTVLIHMIDAGEDSRTLSLEHFNSDQVETNVKLAIRNVLTSHPVAAYAVKDVTYDFGSTGGLSAVVLTVQYNHNRSQIKTLRQVKGMNAAKTLISGALERLEPDIVFQVTDFRNMDFDQFVRDYALEHPDMIMELPQITESVYPETGTTRIVELKFTYETSRDALKTMQNYVRPRFSSAAMFVSGEESPEIRFQKLYAFLMETSEYTFETSITPTYSLLRHSVGDSRAFATVYAAMCRRAGLDCRVISGTREGEPWSWNLISFEERYYHLDLVECHQGGSYQLYFDEEMTGYVWDYAAHPQSVPPELPPETTAPPEPTEPEDTPDETEPETTPPEVTVAPTVPQETEPPTTAETTVPAGE